VFTPNFFSFLLVTMNSHFYLLYNDVLYLRYFFPLYILTLLELFTYFSINVILFNAGKPSQRYLGQYKKTIQRFACVYVSNCGARYIRTVLLACNRCFVIAVRYVISVCDVLSNVTPSEYNYRLNHFDFFFGYRR
jgi:hypothetical protein